VSSLAAASASLRRLRSRSSSVKSTSSTKVECGAVNLLRTIFSAIFLRSPRSGMRSSWAAWGNGTSRGRSRPSGAPAGPASSAATTSTFNTRPCGPVPAMPPKSSPCSRAIRRVTGVASTFTSARGAEATGGALLACVSLAAEGSAARGAPASVSSVTRRACTFAMSPTVPCTESTRPARGVGTVTVALSVISSTRPWSSPTWSPGFTSHWTISPSTTPSPRSGSLNSKVAKAGLPGGKCYGWYLRRVVPAPSTPAGRTPPLGSWSVPGDLPPRRESPSRRPPGGRHRTGPG